MSIKKFLTIALVAISTTTFAQNVGVNADGSTPDASAMLDVKSNNKGVLIPRMTLAERNAISLPATGLLIFQSDNGPGFYYNSGTSALPVWTMISSAGDVQGTLNGLLIGQGTGNASVFLPPAASNNQFLTTTTGGGVPSWATPSDVTGSAVVSVTNGTGQGVGTSNMSIDVSGASGGVMYGTGASSDFTGAGNTGDVLVSGGTGAPMWANPNTTLTTSSLTGSGVVAVTNGGGQMVGSGNASVDVVGTQNGVMYGTGTSSAFTPASTGNNQVLATPTSGGVPQWVNANATLVTSNITPATSSAVVVNNGNNQVVGASPVTVDVQGTSGGVMYGTGAAPAAFTGAGTSGQLLRSNGTAAPTWVTPQSVFSVPVWGGSAGLNNATYQWSGGYVTWSGASAPTAGSTATYTYLTGSFYQASRPVTSLRVSGWLYQTSLATGSYTIAVTKFTGLASGTCGASVGLVGQVGVSLGSCTLNFTGSQYAMKYDIDMTGVSAAALSAGDVLVLTIYNGSGIVKAFYMSGTADFSANVQ